MRRLGSEASPERALPRNVRVLAAVSFFHDCASELIYPILPLFLTGPLGAPAAVVGLVEGLAEGTASVTKAVSGRLADVRRRRPMIAAGYGVSSLAKLLIGFALAWPLVLVARVIDRLGKGVRTSPRDALIVADTAASERGRAFGYHRAADTAGAVVGPLLGLLLYELLDRRLRPLFFVAFVPAAVSTALVFLVREPPSQPTALARPVVSRVDLPRRYWRVLAFLAAFGLVNFSDALLILRAEEVGLGFFGVVGAYVLYNLSYAALSYPAGSLSDRIPRRWVFAGGLAVFAVAYTGLGVTSSETAVWALFAVYGGYTALTDGVGKAWIADLAPAGAAGTALGLYHGVAGGAALVAGVWAGLAWGADGRLPFVVSGAAVAVLAVVLAVGGARLERGDG